eukprot:TRINITY_DN148_c0_g3_i1.p1 TRINITY_DN148_c0_g3~~TRINITY_DN148_c0_g3_i1.p1  ORF type:complete len:952 (-),score=196.00 TRINITY_DN148_c0_g3_i1:39-2894(-)
MNFHFRPILKPKIHPSRDPFLLKQRSFPPFLTPSRWDLSVSLTTITCPFASTDEIINKLAVVIVLIFKNEFPEVWPTFFADLGSALLVPRPARDGAPANHDPNDLDPVLVQTYLAVMREIDTEVVSKEVHRSNEDLAHNRILKDQMRDTGSASHLVDVCYGLLQRYHSSHAGISRSCLSVLRPFIDWIDIGLIVNDRVFPLFLQLLQHPDVQDKALGCILEVVSKGMNEASKVALLKHINVISIMDYFQPQSERATSVFAEFVNQVGIELVAAMLVSSPEMDQQFGSDMQAMFNTVVNHMLRCLANEYDDVSERVEEFAGKYIHYLELTRKRRNPNILDSELEHLKTLLQALRLKLKFDGSFHFQSRGQDELDFIEFRKKLDNIFKAATKLHPALIAEYVASLVNSIDMMNDPLEMESVTHIFNIIGESIPTSGNHGAFIADLLNRLALSKIFNFAQPNELCGEFFECAHRYAPCLAHRTDLFPRLLQLWMSDRGVMHPEPGVRAHRSWLFCGFVKKLKQPLQPFLGDLVDRLKPAVVYNPPVFRRDDEGNTDVVDSVSELTIDMQNDLLESIALLVGFASPGGPGVDTSEKHRTFLELLVTPLVQKIMYILEKQLWKQDNVYQPVNLTWLTNLIGAVGTFSKGFPANLKNQQTFAVQYFANTVPIILQALSEVGGYDIVRAKVVFYMHRMIPCLGPIPMLPHFSRIVELLLSNANLKQTIEVVTLINTAVISFKDQLGPVLDANGLLISVLQYIMRLVTETLSRPNSRGEDEREALELRRMWYSLCSHMAVNNLVNVFSSPNSVGSLNDVLQALLQGLSTLSDPAIVGDSACALAAMVEHWTRPVEAGGLAGFDEFVYKQLLKTVFDVLLNPAYNLGDGKFGVEAMQQIGSIFKELHKNRSTECEQFVQMHLMPAINCPPDVAAAFVERLRQCPDKQFGPILRKFVESRR